MAVIYSFFGYHKISDWFKLGTYLGIFLLIMSPAISQISNKTGVQFGNVLGLCLIGIPLNAGMWFLTLILENTEKKEKMK